MPRSQRSPVHQAEVEELCAVIEDIIEWEDSGHETDWSVYPYEYRRLVREWRHAEREVQRIRDHRFAAYIKAQFKEQ